MDGDTQIGEVLVGYFERLRRLSLARMSKQLQRKVGADEMAGSVLGSVIRAHREGKLSLEIAESEEFWVLLVVIARNKIRKKARYFSAGKRSMSLEVPLTDDMPSLEELATTMDEPEESYADCIADFLSEVQSDLTPDEQLVLEGRLAGEPNEIIAQRLNGGQGMSSKSVTRKWNALAGKIRKLAESDLLA